VGTVANYPCSRCCQSSYLPTSLSRYLFACRRSWSFSVVVVVVVACPPSCRREHSPLSKGGAAAGGGGLPSLLLWLLPFAVAVPFRSLSFSFVPCLCRLPACRLGDERRSPKPHLGRRGRMWALWRTTLAVGVARVVTCPPV
jgi:hypothetical protein